jgi:hypothetical protein
MRERRVCFRPDARLKRTLGGEILRPVQGLWQPRSEIWQHPTLDGAERLRRFVPAYIAVSTSQTTVSRCPQSGSFQPIMSSVISGFLRTMGTGQATRQKR